MHSRLGEPIARKFEHRCPLGASYTCIWSCDNTSARYERVANQMYRRHRLGLGTSSLPAGCIKLICPLVEEEVRLRLFDKTCIHRQRCAALHLCMLPTRNCTQSVRQRTRSDCFSQNNLLPGVNRLGTKKPVRHSQIVQRPVQSCM